MNKIENIKNSYASRITKIFEEQKSLQTKYKQFSVVRLLSFFAFTALVIVGFQVYWWVGIILIYIFLLAFYRIIKYHESIRTQLKHKEVQRELCQAEIQGLENQYSSFRDGSNYLDDNHAYSSDLDIFGTHSLFQKINRCTSLPGEDRLAELLKYGLQIDKIPEYQKACSALENKIQWRQSFYAIGKADFSYQERYHSFKKWLASPRMIKVSPYLQFVLPVLCWIFFVFLTFRIPWHLAFLAFLPTIWVSGRSRKKIDRIHRDLYENEKHLKVFSNSIQFIENSSFSDPLLESLKGKFLSGERKASALIKEAAYILSQLNIRYNIFGILLDLVTLWDHYWSNRLEDWKEKNGSDYLEWMGALAEFEYLSSIASFGFNYPENTFPIFQNTDKITGQALKHPLIHTNQCVPNDLDLPLRGFIKIVTGSNMGGKSTYLRTSGINIVLARAGARICGKKLLLPEVEVYTSMRTQDALKENVSSFYAELKRLGKVLKVVKEKPNTIFLLDEVLKGTNSNDRHKGAKAIIVQLLKYGGSGLISTHDLELGHWAKERKDQLENVCFEVEVVDEELHFDYKLRPGVSKSFNATQLMREIGIEGV